MGKRNNKCRRLCPAELTCHRQSMGVSVLCKVPRLPAAISGIPAFCGLALRLEGNSKIISSSSHKCQSSTPALLPGKSFKSEQLPHSSTLENSQFPWAEIMKDAATVLICLRWKEREGNKATQCSAWGKRNTGSYFRASSWLAANTVMIKQFSNNSCTAKQLSALVSRGLCSGL